MNRAAPLPSARRTVRAAAAAFAVLALAGCTADVRAALDVTSPTDAAVTATVTLTGEAATAVAADQALAEQLVDLVRSRVGTEPDVETDDDQFTVTATMDYTALTDNGDVFGVQAAALTGQDTEVTATLTLIDPTALRAALQNGVAALPDAAAVADTMLAASTVTTAVHFAGGVAEATVDGDLPDAGIGDDTATVTRPLTSAAAGTLTVTGDPTPDRWPWVAGGVGGLLAVAGALAWGRRRDHVPAED